VDAPTGGGGTSTLLNPISKYQVVTTTLQTVWVQSSSTVNTGLAWSKTGGVLTITHAGHSRSIGDMVIVRNADVAYQYGLVTAVTTGTFSIACAAGTASGSAGAYSVGYTYAHNSSTAGQITSGTLTPPSNAPADLQLLSMRVYLGISQRQTTTYTFNIPVGYGAGGTLGTLDDNWSPVILARQASGTAVAVGCVISQNATTATYALSALPAATTAMLFTLQW
jgi:hypothetical protein